MTTIVKIRKVFDATVSKVKAIASITLDDMYVVHGVKLIETDNCRFLAMPSECWHNNQGENMRYDVFHPISQDARKQLEKVVIEAYEEYLAENNPEGCK